MTWRFAFGFIPVPVFYTDSLPEGVGGRAKLVLILIRPEYREDKGIHEHEIEHIEQAYKLGLFGHFLAYKLSRKYRLWAEVRAYKRQIACYPAGTDITWAVDALVNKYRLNITEDEARALLG